MSSLPSAEKRKLRVPDPASEARLQQIRRQAEQQGFVSESGVRPAGAPFPTASPDTGYYGIHLLKEPQWTHDIPLYFFVGGLAGASAVIGAMADWVGRDEEMAQSARWLAFAGAMASSALLVHDLGRPSRFLNMLRVFKVQSAMSVGAWTLTAFGTSSAASVFAKAAERWFGDRFSIRMIGNFGQFFSALFGLPLHTYTGVLIGATTIPVWNSNIKTLPVHFGASGVQSGVSLLELMGHSESGALNMLGVGSALWETWEGIHLERRREDAIKPLKHGLSGTLTRTAGLLSGPLPLTLRLLAAISGKHRSRILRRTAAISGVAGSLLTRYGWVRAGHASARDWRLPLKAAVKPNQADRREAIPETSKIA